MTASKLSPADSSALKAVAASLGVSPTSLEGLIMFESGGNPSIKNPYSSARGLIQFTDATAKGLGYTDSLDLVTKNPTFAGQLRGPVLKYLKSHAPFQNDQALFMAVFLPSYKNKPAGTPFPDSVLAVNPGIKTPLDYMNKVYGKIRNMPTLAAGGGGLALAALSILAFFLLKGKKKKRNA